MSVQVIQMTGYSTVLLNTLFRLTLNKTSTPSIAIPLLPVHSPHKVPVMRKACRCYAVIVGVALRTAFPIIAPT